MEKEIKDIPLIEIKKSYVKDYPPIISIFVENISQLSDTEFDLLLSSMVDAKSEIKRHCNK